MNSTLDRPPQVKTRDVTSITPHAPPNKGISAVNFHFLFFRTWLNIAGLHTRQHPQKKYARDLMI